MILSFFVKPKIHKPRVFCIKIGEFGTKPRNVYNSTQASSSHETNGLQNLSEHHTTKTSLAQPSTHMAKRRDIQRENCVTTKTRNLATITLTPRWHESTYKKYFRIFELIYWNTYSNGETRET
jgi:hypothetical protein